MAPTTTLTYSDELNQSVVEVGTFGQEEAAPGTKVMEEKQFLLLDQNKQIMFKFERDIKLKEQFKTNWFQTMQHLSPLILSKGLV